MPDMIKRPPVLAKLLFCAATLCLTSPPAQPQTPVRAGSKLIGVIKTNDPESGCGCAFQTRAEQKALSDEYIFLSDYNGKARMNIDGQEVELKQTSESNTFRRHKDRDSKGDRTIEVYKGGGVVVRLTETIIRPCRPDDESCESVYKGALIAVTKGRRKQVVRAVGGCGC